MGFRIEFKGKHIKFILVGLSILLLNLMLFAGTVLFGALVILSIAIMFLPFLLDYFAYNQMQKEIEERFPDYVRNLVSAIKSGMPVSRAMIYVAKGDYGQLTYYVKKMGNQIEWNIPVRKVFYNFSMEAGNPIVKRAIATVLQAEKSGGNIEDVLSSITESLMTIKKLKQERKASIQSQIVQSYVIFFIFIGVLITIQNVLIPYLADMESSGQGVSSDAGFGSAGGEDTSEALDDLVAAHEFDFSTPATTLRSIFGWFSSLSGIFIMLAIFQSFFAGVVLGKMSEGDYKAGLRHSFTMMFISVFILTIANSMLSSVL